MKDEMLKLLKEAVEAFNGYENAIDDAQKSYHNYQQWGPEEYGPIDNARTKFSKAVECLKEKLNDSEVIIVPKNHIAALATARLNQKLNKDSRKASESVRYSEERIANLILPKE